MVQSQYETNKPEYFLGNWGRNDIYFINDLIDKEGKFYTHDEFCKKVNFKVNYEDFYGLLHVISINWKRTLKLIR